METHKELLQEKIDELGGLPSQRPSQADIKIYLEQKPESSPKLVASVWPKDIKGRTKSIFSAILGLAALGEVLREVFKK